MLRTSNESSRTLLYSVTVIVVGALAMLYAARYSSPVVQAGTTPVRDANVDFNGDGKTDYVVTSGNYYAIGRSNSFEHVFATVFRPGH